MRRARALLLAAALLAVPPAGAFWHGQAVPVMEPSASWDGSVGSGSCPAVDTTQQVSGLLAQPSVYPAIGNVDAPQQDAIETAGTYQITAAGTAANRTGLAKVRVCLEGTSLDLVAESTNSMTGSHGFNFIIQSRTTAGGQNGLASLIVDYYPRDGYVLRTTQTMWLNSNASGSGYIDRANAPKWVDPVNGTNPSNSCGTGGAGNSKGNAYRTMIRAIACVPDGQYVYVVDGAVLDENGGGCPNGICVSHTHLITVMPEPGGSSFTIAKSVRDASLGYVRFLAYPVKVQNFTVDFTNIWYFYVDGVLIMKDLVVTNGNGLLGGKYGMHADGNLGGWTRQNGTGWIAVLEGSGKNPGSMFGSLTRNFSATQSIDPWVVVTPTAVGSNNRHFNYAPNSIFDNLAPGEGVDPLVVSSVGSFTGGKTTINFSGTPGINASLNSNWTFSVLSGTLQGTDFTIFSSTSTSITVTGDATSMVASDLAWSHINAHVDCFQFFQDSATEVNYENIYVQNFKCRGTTAQAILPQPQSFSTASTMSTVGTAFSMDTMTVGSVGAFSGGQTVVTFSGSPTLGSSVPASQRFYFNTGALAGQNFAVAALNNTSKTVTLTGDATGAGATDTGQFGHNMATDNYVSVGTGTSTEGHTFTASTSTTLTLREAFTAGNLTNQVWTRAKSTSGVAIVGSMLERSTRVNGDFGQFGGANRNWIIAQTTVLNDFLNRTTSNFIFDNVAVLDSTFFSFQTDFGIFIPTASYWPWDNNQIQSTSNACSSGDIGSGKCGSNTSLGTITIDVGNPVVSFGNGDLGNEGNGTISNLSVGASPQVGTYLITLTDGNGTYTGVTHFTVQRPDLTFAASGTVGTPYTSTDINFTITAGATPFNYFDRFIVQPTTTYRPTSGLTKTMTGNIATNRPLYGWNLDGTPISQGIGSALIGAQQP